MVKYILPEDIALDIKNKRYKAAIAGLNALYDKANDDYILNDIAVLYFKNNQLQLAYESCIILLESSREPKIIVTSIAILLEMGHLKESEEFIQSHSNLIDPVQKQALLSKLDRLNDFVFELHRKNKFKEILKYFDSDREPKNYDEYLIYADALIKDKQHLHAIKFLEHALNLNSENHAVLNALASCYRKVGRAHEAESYFLKAVKIADGSSNEAVLNLANLYSELDQPAKVISLLSDDTNLAYTHPKANEKVSLELLRASKITEALELTYKMYESAGDNAALKDPYINILSLMGHVKSEPNNLIKLHNFCVAEGENLISEGIRNGHNFLITKFNSLFSDYDVSTYTLQSQIYFGRVGTLGCGRHFRLFEAYKIIPKSCFSCFKVQINVPSLTNLIELSLILKNLKLPNDNSRKCMIEMRDGVSGRYKGFIYCNSINECNFVKDKLLENRIQTDWIKFKHGCSEYGHKYPQFESTIEQDYTEVYQDKWDDIEHTFDQNIDILKLNEPYQYETKNWFNLRDLMIIKNWYQYAFVKEKFNFPELSEDLFYNPYIRQLALKHP